MQGLQQRGRLLGLAELSGREWYELLRQKLVPQLEATGWLVAAVVGGTNIGKSVVFNHLVGSRASAVSPLASGTRHPTCLVPGRFADPQRLQRIFPDFELRRWESAEGALEDTDRNLLFWRAAAELPDWLLVLDTPDIDSDARVNWQRADAVRRSADVLIAVLTQQKYNDAAVKEFFRRGAREGRSALVIFNQLHLPDDEPYWPVWLQTFSRETGLRPESVFVAPADRRAAEELRLPFFERRFAAEGLANAENSGQEIDLQRVVHPGAELARLRFGELRIRSLRGSLEELLHEVRGVPAWLQELGLASDDLRRAAQRLTVEGLISVRDWPSPGGAVFSTGIRDWWREHQTGWARAINSAYSAAGRLVLRPLTALRGVIQGPVAEDVDVYRQREWSAILRVLEDVFERLSWLAESGHPVIRERAGKLLSGEVRSGLLDLLRRQHLEVDFDRELREVIDEQMRRMQRERPDAFLLCRHAGNVSAALRPVASVVFFSLGFGPAGEFAATAIGHAAASTLVHVVADVAGGAAAAVAGEAAVSTAAGSGASLLQAWFQRLQDEYFARRGNWLMERLQRELLGSLAEDLREAAGLRESQEWRDAQLHVAGLKQELQEVGDGTQGGEQA
ncbi:MAG: GTPase domain-containing protein [Planctomycetota bacterium]